MSKIKPIKVISLNHTDYFGGAAKSVYRLSECLNTIGLKSLIICNQKTTKNKNVFAIKDLYNITDRFIILIQRIIKLICRKLFNKKENYIKGCSEINDSIIYSVLDRLEFDILHLNWVVGGFINFKDMKNITKPIVVTLHDASFFTGICHVIGDCINYSNECGYCPKLDSKSKYDLSYKTLLLKEERYKSLNLSFISPSLWMADVAKKSKLLSHSRIDIIPNGIDTNKFKPIKKKTAKKKLGLDENKRYISIGAVDLMDENKGFQFIIKLLNEFQFDNDIEFLAFGKSDLNVPLNKPIQMLGYLESEESLMQLYSASDIVIVPSKQESFGQTALESIACGTPVVAFNTSGLKDIIEHKINGYMAIPYNVNDLFNGINWCLNQNISLLSKNAREIAVAKFDIKQIAQKHKDLFQKLLQ